MFLFLKKLNELKIIGKVAVLLQLFSHLHNVWGVLAGDDGQLWPGCSGRCQVRKSAVLLCVPLPCCHSVETQLLGREGCPLASFGAEAPSYPAVSRGPWSLGTGLEPLCKGKEKGLFWSLFFLFAPVWWLFSGWMVLPGVSSPSSTTRLSSVSPFSCRKWTQSG